MKVHLHTRRVAAICGITLAVGMAMRTRADEWDKRTILTINQPMQVTDKLLEPGQYVFKLLDSASNRHIVQIFNRDQNHLIGTILAIPNYRLQPTGDSRFAFWETPPGNAQALRAWFYPGDNFGQEFPYPKHPIVLTASTTKTTVRSQETADRSTTETTVVPAPAPEPAPAAEVQPPAKAEEPVEVAQNTPPPAPAPEARPAPAPPAQPEPAELPHTASPYPLIGFGGLLAVGLSGLLRLKRLV